MENLKLYEHFGGKDFVEISGKIEPDFQTVEIRLTTGSGSESITLDRNQLIQLSIHIEYLLDGH